MSMFRRLYRGETNIQFIDHRKRWYLASLVMIVICLFSITFSGFNFTATFLNLFLEVGVDRIMFSADHPYASMAEARAFLDHLPVSPSDRERIAHVNAEALFGL